MIELLIRDELIPELKKKVGFPIIQGNQNVTPPETDHAVFNFTTLAQKDVGLESLTMEPGADGELYAVYTQEFKTVMSLTTVVEVDGDVTHAAAQDASLKNASDMLQWFTIFGRSFIISKNIAVTNVSEIQPRDSINEDEYRWGFDVTMRYTQEVRVKEDFFTQIYVQEERG